MPILLSSLQSMPVVSCGQTHHTRDTVTPALLPPVPRRGRHHAVVMPESLGADGSASETTTPSVPQDPHADGSEAGFAQALQAQLVSFLPAAETERDPRQLTILASPLLSAADQQWLVQCVRHYGLMPLLLAPGHPLHRSQLYELVHSVATLVIGDSLHHVADWLASHTRIPDYRFSGLHDLEQCDRLHQVLGRLSRRLTPAPYRQQRQRLQRLFLQTSRLYDAVHIGLDCESDWLFAHHRLYHHLGLRLECVVLPAVPLLWHPRVQPHWQTLPCRRLFVGPEVNLADTMTTGIDLLLTTRRPGTQSRFRLPTQMQVSASDNTVSIGYSGCLHRLQHLNTALQRFCTRDHAGDSFPDLRMLFSQSAPFG